VLYSTAGKGRFLTDGRGKRERTLLSPSGKRRLFPLGRRKEGKGKEHLEKEIDGF